MAQCRQRPSPRGGQAALERGFPVSQTAARVGRSLTLRLRSGGSAWPALPSMRCAAATNFITRIQWSPWGKMVTMQTQSSSHPGKPGLVRQKSQCREEWMKKTIGGITMLVG
jgi:hypothetical protein